MAALETGQALEMQHVVPMRSRPPIPEGDIRP